MGRSCEFMRAKIDNYTRVCLTVIAVLLTVLVVGLWSEGGSSTPQARAAEPWLNTGAQRKEMVQQQEQTNQKLQQIVEILQSGAIRVVVAQDEPTPQSAPEVLKGNGKIEIKPTK